MRRKTKTKRSLSPDIAFQSLKVAQLVNYLMQDGKKELARRVVAEAMAEIKKETKEDPLQIFEQAVHNVSPVMEVRSRRVGGANYQIPHEVSASRRLTLALRWIVNFARLKKGKPMSKRLAEEVMAASRNEGESVKKRENMQKMADANRAFAHFARGRRSF